MEFDTTTTVAVFLGLVALGVAGLVAAPLPMTASTILMMVAPSMLVFGALCLGIGVKFGEYRAAAR
ncbi:hypothetical protein [Halosegnis sp.]|uniref:DUF7333 family protein n=1 Tax=Halosegnis sp. TaxID=2864959 RepID=UPI0035D412F3